MNSAHWYLLAAAAFGAVLCLLISVQALLVWIAGALGVLILGLVVAGTLRLEESTWFFGIALMVFPIYGASVLGGGALSRILIRFLRRRRERNQRSDRCV